MNLTVALTGMLPGTVRGRNPLAARWTARPFRLGLEVLEHVPQPRSAEAAIP
jgi:hypothetical protein